VQNHSSKAHCLQFELSNCHVSFLNLKKESNFSSEKSNMSHVVFKKNKFRDAKE